MSGWPEKSLVKVNREDGKTIAALARQYSFEEDKKVTQAEIVARLLALAKGKALEEKQP